MEHFQRARVLLEVALVRHAPTDATEEQRAELTGALDENQRAIALIRLSLASGGPVLGPCG